MMSGCASTKRYSMSRNPEEVYSDDMMYRVVLNNTTGCVEVSCIGMNCIDSTLDGLYGGVKELPQWMQEKVALLMMTSYTPPVTPIRGVGQRIREDTFWIYD